MTRISRGNRHILFRIPAGTMKFWFLFNSYYLQKYLKQSRKPIKNFQKPKILHQYQNFSKFFAPFQIPLSENLQRIIIKKKHISKNRLFLSYQYEYERDKYFQKFLSSLARRQILITPLILDRLQFQSSDNGRAKSRHSTPACSTTPYINRAGLSAARVTRSP